MAVSIWFLTIWNKIWKKLTGGRRTWGNKELHNLYSSTKISRAIKSRIMKMLLVACRWIKNACKILIGKPEERKNLRDKTPAVSKRMV
jgi:hypothetical protein